MDLKEVCVYVGGVMVIIAIIILPSLDFITKIGIIGVLLFLIGVSNTDEYPIPRHIHNSDDIVISKELLEKLEELVK